MNFEKQQFYSMKYAYFKSSFSLVVFLVLKRGRSIECSLILFTYFQCFPDLTSHTCCLLTYSVQIYPIVQRIITSSTCAVYITLLKRVRALIMRNSFHFYNVYFYCWWAKFCFGTREKYEILGSSTINSNSE